MTSTLRHLAPILSLFLAERRGLLLSGAVLALATVLAGIALLGLSGWFITATALAGLSASTALAFDVFAPAAAIRFLALARTGARYGERIAGHEATLRVLAALRERLFRGWAEPGAARRLIARPAKVLFRLTADIDALDSLYLRGLVPLGAALGAALAAGLALGLLVDPRLGLAAGAFLAVAGFGTVIAAGRRALAPARRRGYAAEALRSRAVDLVSGQTELVMVGRLTAQMAAVAAADARLAAAERSLNRIETGAAAVSAAAASLLLAGTLVAVALLAEAGRIGAPLAALAVLIVFAAMEPFGALARGALEFGRTMLAARRVGPRLAPAAPPAPARAPAPGVALVLAGVAAVHEGDARPVLAGIDLTVMCGERVALVGPSGAGKSTLLALAAGEMAPAAGTVARLPATVLTQRTELFRDSLRDNLKLAAPGAGDALLWGALAEAGLAADVAALPGGIDSRLGEGGLGLSGGQGRRLALARLLLRDAPLWLLDEPTEGLDGATARDVMARLTARAAGRAVLVATHIRREAEGADRLLVLEHGRIIAAPARGEPAFAIALAALRPD